MRAAKTNFLTKNNTKFKPMAQLVLRAVDVQKILNTCRSDSYRVIKEIREHYPDSAKLSGSKIRTEDLAFEYNLKLEAIERCLKE